MEKVKTILLNKGIFSDNDAEADKLRQNLEKEGVFLINVMSSPGAGKTTTLISLINRLKTRFNVGVMEADIGLQIRSASHGRNVPPRRLYDEAGA